MSDRPQFSPPLETKPVPGQFYRVKTALNLYDSPALEKLASQAAAGRYLRFLALPEAHYSTTEADNQKTNHALTVCLWEDDYPGWLAIADFVHLQPTVPPSLPPLLSAAEIQARIPQVIAFCLQAMQQPNYYLWGGTVGPNYDCSGLVQHSFASQGIALPRDAYQQEAFVQPIPNPGSEPIDLIPHLIPGDLIFFGTPEKATHVAIYLGEGKYIHSSGQQQGRNGIGIDALHPEGDQVTQAYYAQVRGAGRVVANVIPSNDLTGIEHTNA